MATPFEGLEGEQRDIAVALNDLFTSYGLGSLAPKILEFIKQGYDGNTVAILLQETSEYKERFKANEVRRAKGLPVLNPQEYLATERAYREILNFAGLPMGFYDQPEDFRKWLEDDVSPQEIKGRVDAAVKLVNSVDPQTRAVFEQWYTTGDLIAYALDRTRALPILERQVRAAEVGAEARRQGVGVGSNLAEQLADRGINTERAAAGFGFIAGERDRAAVLSSIYDGEDVGEGDLIQEVFFDDAAAARRRRTLASRERAAFSGSSAVNQRSLTRGTAGNV